MRKKISTIILLCTLSITLPAQKDSIITDFLEEGTKWVELDLVFDYMERVEKSGNKEYIATINVYEIIGDTIINDSIHWKVRCKGYPSNNLSICYKTEYPYHYIGTKNGLIWHDSYKRINYNVLYELGGCFEIGNTIRYYSLYSDSIFVDTIHKIDTITFCNGYKAIIANDEYIYGLGHKKHPLYWSFENWNPTSNYYHSLNRFLCFYYRGEIILQDDKLMEQIKKSIGIDPNQIIPFTIKEQSESETDAPIYDLTGRKLDRVPEKGLYIQGGRKRLVR